LQVGARKVDWQPAVIRAEAGAKLPYPGEETIAEEKHALCLTRDHPGNHSVGKSLTRRLT
jgi:hypothetical protein